MRCWQTQVPRENRGRDALQAGILEVRGQSMGNTPTVLSSLRWWYNVGKTVKHHPSYPAMAFAVARRSSDGPPATAAPAGCFFKL
jgi:hypothetical protein